MDSPRIEVHGGDYVYQGHIVSVFKKRRRGMVRVVVEDDNGRLFIHNKDQLRFEHPADHAWLEQEIARLT